MKLDWPVSKPIFAPVSHNPGCVIALGWGSNNSALAWVSPYHDRAVLFAAARRARTAARCSWGGRSCCDLTCRRRDRRVIWGRWRRRRLPRGRLRRRGGWMGRVSAGQQLAHACTRLDRMRLPDANLASSCISAAFACNRCNRMQTGDLTDACPFGERRDGGGAAAAAGEQEQATGRHTPDR